MVGAACYSSFLAAVPLGSRLSPADSYVSELEVPGQPASAFFRLTDLVAALCIAVLAVAVGVRLRPAARATVGCVFLAGAGLASLGDALAPLPCTPSTSQDCRHYVNKVDVLAQLHQQHTVSSIVGLVAVVTAMLLLGGSGRLRRWAPRLARSSRTVGAAVAVLACCEVPLAYLGHGVGAAERLHVLLISAWLAALGCWLPRRRLPHSAASSRPDRGRWAGWRTPWKTATSTSSTGPGSARNRSSRSMRYSGC
jgi:hypothetical protein